MRNILLTSMLATGIAAMAAYAPAISSSAPVNRHNSPASLMKERNQASARHGLRTPQGTPMKAPAVKRSTTDTPPTTMPEGPAENLPRLLMSKSGIGYMNFYGYIIEQPNDGSATYVVYDGDKVYVSNIWSLTSTDGWIVGSKEGDKVTFEFPQLAYSFEDEGTLRYDYAVLAEIAEVEIEGEIVQTYVPTEQQKLTFTVGDDGTLTNDSPELMLGDFFQQKNKGSDELAWLWVGGGDILTALSPVTATAAELPEGAAAEEMMLVINDWGYASKMAIVGDKCYLAGLAQFSSPDFKDVYVVGDVNGDKISFPSGQFLGVDDSILFINYMIGGTIVEVYDPDYDEYYDDIEPKEALVFDYDAEKKTLFSEDGMVICSTPELDMYYFNMAGGFEVFPYNQDAKIEKLREPVAYFYPAEVDHNGDPLEYAELDFSFSNISAEGVIIDTDALYFQLEFDDELYEFYPDEYPVIEEPTYAMPVGLSDNETIACTGNRQALIIFPEGFETLKLRLMYKPGEDAEPIYSDWVLCYQTDGVQGVAAERVSSSFIDMQGRRINNPASGLYIRADRMSDGTTVYTKIMVR